MNDSLSASDYGLLIGAAAFGNIVAGPPGLFACTILAALVVRMRK